MPLKMIFQPKLRKISLLIVEQRDMEGRLPRWAGEGRCCPILGPKIASVVPRQDCQVFNNSLPSLSLQLQSAAAGMELQLLVQVELQVVAQF